MATGKSLGRDCGPYLNWGNHRGMFGNKNGELDPWKMLCSGERDPTFWNTFETIPQGIVQMWKHPHIASSMRWIYFREKQMNSQIILLTWMQFLFLQILATFLKVVTKYLTEATLGRVALAYSLRVHFITAGGHGCRSMMLLVPWHP